MIELLVVIVTALVVIAAATVVGPRLGIAAPLVLVANGVAAGSPPEGNPAPAQFESAKAHRLAVLDAQRAALLDARVNGTFDADVLPHALAGLDASQIAIELRGTRPG